jgi:Spy/CpxP family protein refolding chaperone
MNTFGRTLVVSSLALATAVAGAAHAWPGSSPAKGPAGSESQSDPSSGQPQGKENDPHAQMQRIVEQALADLQLSPEQRESVDRIRGTLTQREAPVRQARGDLMSAIAQQVAAGRVDRAALEPKIDAFVKAMTTASPAMRGAIEELHAVLTPAQRSQLVDEIQRALDQKKQQQGGEHKAMLEKMSKDLGLTRHQKRDLASAFNKLRPSFDDARQNLDRVLDAFRADVFAIDQIIPQREVAARAVTLTQAIVDMADTATNVLTAEQRARVGDELRQVANAGGAPAGQAGQTGGGSEPSGQRAGGTSGPGQDQGGPASSGGHASGAGQSGATPSGGAMHGGHSGQPDASHGTGNAGRAGSSGATSGSSGRSGGGTDGNIDSSRSGGAHDASGSAHRAGSGTKKSGPPKRSNPCIGEAKQSCAVQSDEQRLEAEDDDAAIAEDQAALEADDGAAVDDDGATGESADALHGWGRYGRRFGRYGGGWGGYRGGYYGGYVQPTFDDVFVGGYGYSPYYGAYPGGYSYSWGVPFYGGYGYVW